MYWLRTGTGVIRAYDSLKACCDEANLQIADRITSINLRKYFATMSQVFDHRRSSYHIKDYDMTG